MKKNHVRNKYVNKRFATFPTMIKHEKHIDNRTKTFEDKVFISHKKAHENAIIQNEKP